MRHLADRIRCAYDGADPFDAGELRALFDELCAALERGEVRAAEPAGDDWIVNDFVKQGLLLGFRIGELRAVGSVAGIVDCYDKDTLGSRRLALDDRVRLVPGGSSVRRGAYVAPGVTIMPPAFVNIAAHVDRETLIDSHALVGSCAQIGARVHLSAAAQIGGVLEPIGQLPVIVEDDALISGNCGVYEGVIVRRGAVLGSGTILNGSTVLYDLVHSRELRAGPGRPLEVPARAVVVPGARPLRGAFAEQRGLCVQTPVIVKYRDANTDARAALEGVLRDANT
ncbi:MAG: 2,3,4,5-tetrahydropyridine-2,6-dicarboxylate N-succinyltransferase [Deltaproteobacteria bacterium]|nr:2,3,4,5-tetrahydropyridine-2,6-dicarboxylate N-succinyltransferase [Deltaproteobacteria bacterium]